MPEGSRKKQRISVVTAICMVALAIVFDGLQDIALFINVIPAIGQVIDVAFSWFISFLAAVSFGIWFAVLRVNYFSGRKAGQKLLVMFSSVIVELVPYVDALPAITFGVVSLIILTRLEDSGMTGAGIMQTVAGIGQAAGALGIKGAGTASKALSGAGAGLPRPSGPSSPIRTGAGGQSGPLSEGRTGALAPRTSLRPPPARSSSPADGAGDSARPVRQASLARSSLQPPPRRPEPPDEQDALERTRRRGRGR